MGWSRHPRIKTKARTARERGAVAVEFALSLFLLIPLLLATLDYGYFFWIAMHATAAVQAGARAGAVTAGLTAACPAVPTAAGVINANTAVATEMNKTYLASTSWSTPFNTCDTSVVGVSPVWKINVQVDFTPPAGLMLQFMPRPAGTPAGMTRYTTKTLYMPP